MEKSLKYRLALVTVILVVAFTSLVPSVKYDYGNNKSELPEWWTDGFLSGVLPQKHLTLGLDLQGGMDVVLGVNAEQAVVNELKYITEVIGDYFKDRDVKYTSLELDAKAQAIKVVFPDREVMEKGARVISKNFASLVIKEGEDTLKQTYTLRESEKRHVLSKSIDQVREILARRIDNLGLTEPEIAVQGDNQIRVQLPGRQDPERIKKILRESGKLEFMIVSGVGRTRESVEQQTGAKPQGMNLVTWQDPTRPDFKVECYFTMDVGVSEGPVPPRRRLAEGKESMEDQAGATCYLLTEEMMVSGKDLKDARPGYDPNNTYASVVNFQLNMKGAQRFGKLTGENVQERLAIVLEDKVVTAPVIQSKIFNRGQITGGFTQEEATDLANVLRSGAMDVSIIIEEERTVGATLGADSIHKGQVAIFWGFIVVILFMGVYYSIGGLIADFALLMNLVLIMSALSFFGATLTLPGIAGLVLTVGMAVDANVLIFERVREELRTGKTPRASIEAGYAKALWTILDANITTMIAALVLLQWGTGPIKGFAVTLALGIVSSLFTAIVVTRVVYDLIFSTQKDAKLRIGISLEPAADLEGKR